MPIKVFSTRVHAPVADPVAGPKRSTSGVIPATDAAYPCCWPPLKKEHIETQTVRTVIFVGSAQNLSSPEHPSSWKIAKENTAPITVPSRR